MTHSPGGSYKKVSYDLRPAKQVERRMLLDSLQILANDGFSVRDHLYVGMGSIYYVDYVLFHKYLGINRMVSVECCTQDAKRAQFNRPFDASVVDLRIDLIGNVISKLPRDEKVFAWLDYDCWLNEDIVNDITAAAFILAPGSILLVTVDAEYPEILDPVDGVTPRRAQIPDECHKFYLKVAGNYFDPTWSTQDFSQDRVPNTLVHLGFRIIGSGEAHRSDGASLAPLFSFCYADKHSMVSFGGMIAGPTEAKILQKSSLQNEFFIRSDPSMPPYPIRVPCLTRKERLYLESNMPCRPGWKPSEFDLDQEDLKAFCEAYRYHPSYVEVLL
jgi:hypothetical protein